MVLGFIVVLAALAAWLLPSRELHPRADVDFQLLDGRTTSLKALRGHPALIAFWATTCLPCIREIPDLVKLYQEFEPRGLRMIAVTLPYDPPSQVLHFVQQHRLPYPVALDISGEVGRAFGGVSFIPTTFMLDANGNVLFRRTGRLDLGRTREVLERLIPEKSSMPASSL